MKISLSGLSLLFLALAALAWFVLMTAPGARLALGFAEARIPGALSYELLSGQLIGPLELTGARYEHGSMSVRAERLTVDWRPLALLDRRVHVTSLHLQGVDGRLDPDARSEESDQAQGSEQRENNGAQGREPARDSGAAREGGAAGEGGEPGGRSLAVQFDDLQADGVRFVAGEWAAILEANLAARGTLDAFALELNGELVADPLPVSRFDLTGGGSLSGLALESLSLVSEVGAVDAAGEIAWQPTLEWDLEVRGDSLAPGAVAEEPADWPGWLSLSASTRGLLIEGRPAAEVTLDTLYGSVRGYPISGRAELEIDGSRIFVPDTEVLWGPLAIRADGVYTDTVDFAFDISAPNLAGLFPGGRGSLRAEGMASGPRSSPHVEASLSARDVAYRDVTLQRAEGRVVLDLSSSGAVDATLLLQALEAPQIGVDRLDVAIRGRVDAHDIGLRAEGGDGALAVRARGGVTGETWRGQIEELEIETPGFGEWSLRAPASLALDGGTISLGELCLAGAEGAACAAGEYAGEDAWQAVGSLEGIPLAIARRFLPPDLALEGDVNASFDLASSGTGLPVGRAEVFVSYGQAEFVRAEDTVRVDYAGELGLISSDDGLTGELDATLSPGEGGGSARIAVRLAAPDVASAIERGALLETLTRGDWEANVRAEELHLSRLKAFLPAFEAFEGALDATVDATAEAGQVRGELAIEPSTGSMRLVGDDESRSLEFRELSVRLTADDTGVTGGARFSLHGLNDRSLGGMRVEARSDALVLGQPLLGRALEADVEGSFDLATVAPLTRGFVEAAGSADLDFSLRRLEDTWETQGRARALGSARIPVLGIELEDLDLSIDGDGYRLVVDGRVSSGEGRLTLSGERVSGETTSLRLEGDRFLAIARDELRLEIAPDLQLAASGTRVDLSGEVVVPTARIQLLEVPDTGVGVSKDVVLVGVDTEREIEEPTILEVFTDVSLSLGDDVSFRGFGITTMIDGSLRVTDEPSSPTRAEGRLTLRDGRFRGFGLNLVVDPGEMIFNGPIDNPRLRIIAYRQADDGTRAGFAINGPADGALLGIWSEPPLSDQEAVSYMFSGQPLDRGSTQLNRANTQQIQSEGGTALMGSNVLTQAAGMAIGLDETRIDAGDRREDAEFIAGKYVTPRLYVAYVTGLFEAVNVLRIRYTLYKGFRLQVETGTRSTADLLYRFDVGR